MARVGIRSLQLAAAVIAALFLSQSSAHAQIGARLDRNTPVIFKADHLRNEQQLGIVVATGNVEFSQGKRTLLADKRN